jgi:single-strand DNA-binding protein
MASLNKVLIIGNVAEAPQLRQTSQGTSVANARIGSTHKWKDQDGRQQKRTEWFNVTFWGRLAEVAAQYVTTRNPIFVEGRQQTKSWQDEQGQTRYQTTVQATNLQLLGGASQTAQVAPQAGQQSQPQPMPAPVQAAPPQTAPATGEPTFDDDIPF